MAVAAAGAEGKSPLEGWRQTIALAPLVIVAVLCLASRFGQRLDPTDAVAARAEPGPIAAMRHMFPETNAAVDDASGQATSRGEDPKLAVAYFRGWMRERAPDILRAPDDAILGVAAARLHVLLAARAEDPRLCVQYARAPAGGVERPVIAPSPFLAQAVDDELVQEVTAARAGVDHPVVRPTDPKPWTAPEVRRRADWYTALALRGSPRLEHATRAHQCHAYLAAYRLALSLPSNEGANLAATLLGYVLPAAGERAPATAS